MQLWLKNTHERSDTFIRLHMMFNQFDLLVIDFHYFPTFERPIIPLTFTPEKYDKRFNFEVVTAGRGDQICKRSIVYYVHMRIFFWVLIFAINQELSSFVKYGRAPSLIGQTLIRCGDNFRPYLSNVRAKSHISKFQSPRTNTVKHTSGSCWQF